MIPLRDVIPSRTTPYVTIALVVVNALVFVYELSLGDHINQFMFAYGLVPVSFNWASVLTSMFLHGGFLHVAGNMLYLWIFGDNVEDQMGHGRFLAFYLLCGIAAALAQALTVPGSMVPMVGASGAIAGVMGAYFILYPSARVLTLVPFLFVFFLWLPAWIVLGYWIVTQFLWGAATSVAYSSQTSGGIAFWAHVGGFAAGIALIKLFPSRPRRFRYDA